MLPNNCMYTFLETLRHRQLTYGHSESGQQGTQQHGQHIKVSVCAVKKIAKLPARSTQQA